MMENRGWREVKLGEVCKIISNKTSIENATLENYISTENMVNDFGGVKIAEKLPATTTINSFIQKDILFSNIRTYFKKVWFASFSGTHSQDVLNFRANEVVDEKFLFYQLCTPDFTEYTVLTSKGAKMPRGDKDAIKQYEISLPPLPEQKAIASVLSSLDDKIHLLHQQNQTLEALAETLFRQWFVEEAKEDWSLVRIGEFVEINSSTVSKGYPHQFINYLDTSSLTEGIISSFQYLSMREAPSRAKRLVKHNDILISTVRPDQKHYGIIKEPKENLVVSTGFCVITCSDISTYFIYLLLTNDEMTDYLHSIAEGSTSTYPSLKPSDIEKIEFLLPPRERLSDFDDIADNYFVKIKSNHDQIQTLTKLRDTLLPKLMSSEVRVKH